MASCFTFLWIPSWMSTRQLGSQAGPQPRHRAFGELRSAPTSEWKPKGQIMSYDVKPVGNLAAFLGPHFENWRIREGCRKPSSKRGRHVVGAQ